MSEDAVSTIETAPLAPEQEAPEIIREHPDGVYFGMDADEYHDDTALGSTDIRNLLIHPAQYWWNSWMNPVSERRETDWSTWGSAFHALICEGRKAFEERYYRGPAKSDFPNLMVTMEHMKRWLQLRGFATTGNKDALIKRVLAADPDAPVWDEIVAKAEILAEGRIVLKPEVYDSVSLSSMMITKNPSCANAFTNGYPEVSVFWTRNGIRLKARFDYLRFKAVVDLKSFRNWRDKPMDIAIFQTIAAHRYDIQGAHYIEARRQIPTLVEAGAVFGKVSSAWLKRLVATKDFRYVWIFYHAENAPIAKRVDYFPEADYHEAAEREIRLALERYRRHLDVFGTDIWVDVSEAHNLTSEDLPSWMGMGTA
ncbi:PD-(D/E)XK nuclease-like domain-containing protein [Bradyrhizobium sp. Leo121]|uniref:PD-(D/E)XK nuclease-like domain-containing protein n=1 Tax=Bradyrhizobium sp. Leo121 TaxID=1571195 RepID=UPI0013EF279C|nr:PD-(D/E)XK nuclease-like domain-containing protein [Bradyrhizobium sp. Leo121]